MNKKLRLSLIAAGSLLTLPFQNMAQAPTLGTAANFVLFSSNGAISNTGISHLTGNIGTNNGSSTAFGNIDGVMHDANGTTAAAKADLLLAYNQLDAAIPTLTLAPLLGNGQTVLKGTYYVGAAATLSLDLNLDAGGDANAVFIFQINGAFSTNASAKVNLLNGAQACNVFWKVEGKVAMATGTTMRGTVIANNAEITAATGDTLEGRLLSTTGAVTVAGIYAYTPIGCNSPVLTGPNAPKLGTAECFGLFTGSGDVANAGITNVSGDIGTNSGTVAGFDPLLVNGTIHPGPDNTTQKAANDLTVAYTYLNTLPFDIELKFPAQLGSNLVLTPHTYKMGGAATLTGNLILNAQGNPDAVFVFQIDGALSTGTYANVKLMNGAQSKNVYWKVEGAVTISDYSVFRGTIINNGALGALQTGVVLDGRALTITGALNTAAITTTLVSKCTTTGLTDSDTYNTDAANVSPNPFQAITTIHLKQSIGSAEIKIMNSNGEEVMNSALNSQSTTIQTSHLPSGIYFYSITSGGKSIQTGKIISQQ